MNTIKIKLSLSGRVAALDKNFPLFQGQFANTLLNVSVPTAMLAADFEIQHFIGNYSSVKAITDASLQDDLDAFVLSHTSVYDEETETWVGREPVQGDVIFYTDTTNDKFYRAVYGGVYWGFTEVPYFAMGNFAGTSVKIGVLAVARNGVQYKSKSYYMRYVKTYTANDGIEYAMYERKMPREFTAYEGQGQNAPTVIINVVNATAGVGVENIVTSQTCDFDVMPSTQLDEDEPIEPTAQEEIWGAINDIAEEMSEITADFSTKQDKVDNGLHTSANTVVGAINEVKVTADSADARSIANAGEIADLKSIVGTGENYIGTLTLDHAPTSAELDAFVLAQAGRAPQGNDMVIVVEQIAGATDKTYKYLYKAATSSWGYFEIPPFEKAANGTAGIVSGTYGVKNYNTLVNIIDGEIQNIYIKINGNYLDIRDVILGDKDDIAKIVDGTTVVAEALKATQDALGNNIVNTYLTQTAGATKDFVRNYALPKQFNNPLYLASAGEGVYEFTDTVPSVSSWNSVSSALIGENLLIEADYELEDVKFLLSRQNSYTARYFFEKSVLSPTNTTENMQFKLATYLQKQGQSPVLVSTELTGTYVVFENAIIGIDLSSAFTDLGNDTFSMEDGDKLIQKFYAIRESSNTCNLRVYFGGTYPTQLFLNTSTQTFTVRETAVGEIPIVYIDQNNLSVQSMYYKDGLVTGTINALVCNISDDTLIDAIVNGYSAYFEIDISDFAVALLQFDAIVLKYEKNGIEYYENISSPAGTFISKQYSRIMRVHNQSSYYYYKINATIQSGVNILARPDELRATAADPAYPSFGRCIVTNEPNFDPIVGAASLSMFPPKLVAANWAADGTYTLDLSSFARENDEITFRPHADSDAEIASEIGLAAEADTTSLIVTFKANIVPTVDITLDYYINRGSL